MAKKIVNANLVTALLVVIAVLWCGSVISAGDLEPSAAPAPTMKTLDEVEPRIPISQTDIPKTISTSGSYYLTENITAAGTAITVNVDDVTIDLSGFAIVGPDTGTNYGIYMNGRKNVEIRNGTVRGFYNGIYEDHGNLGQNHRVIDVRVMSNSQDGIILYGSGHLVKNCTVSDNGDSTSSWFCGIRVLDHSTVIGNTVNNNGKSATNYVWCISVGHYSKVSGNMIYENGESVTGSSSNYVTGISSGDGCTVTDNTVNNNGKSAVCSVTGISAGKGCTVSGNTSQNNGFQAGNNVYGIYTNVSCTVIGNTSRSNGEEATGSSVYGINTVSGCTLTNNTACDNGKSASGDVYGIHANDGCTVIGNTAYNNGDTAGGDVYGIYLVGNSLVDQNTTYDNNTGSGGTNMTLGVAGCVYGINVAP